MKFALAALVLACIVVRAKNQMRGRACLCQPVIDDLTALMHKCYKTPYAPGSRHSKLKIFLCVSGGLRKTPSLKEIDDVCGKYRFFVLYDFINCIDKMAWCNRKPGDPAIC